MNNKELFTHSLDNPEPIIDESFIKQGKLLINIDETRLMKKNKELINKITD